MKKTVFTLVVTVILMQSCGSTKPGFDQDLQANFDKGKELFDDEKYFKATEFFTWVVFNSPGSEIADDAQFYLAECHYELKEYIVAVDEYNRLISRWPASDLAENARYKLAYSYHKMSPKKELYQDYTEEAIVAYQSFLEDYPDSKFRTEAENAIIELRQKLAQKILGTGSLYMVFREWQAAVISLEEIENKYFDTNAADIAYLMMAECYRNLEDPAKTSYYLEQVDSEKLEKVRDRKLYESLKHPKP